MKWTKQLVVVVLACVMVMSLQGIVSAGKQDFTLVNKSPFKIVGFWVAPADSDDWEENILDGMSVASNESIDITFDNANNVTWWNFRIKDSSGKIWNWEKNKYNLTQISELTYYYNANGSPAIIRRAVCINGQLYHFSNVTMNQPRIV